MAPAKKNARSSTRRSKAAKRRGPPAATNPNAAPDITQPALAPEVLRSQPPKKARYLDTSLPPLHDIKEIFADLLAKANQLGFRALLERLENRPLRVATVCSGTESPVLVLEMIQKVDSTKSFSFTHEFSCEIVAFKQAYIERNFGPPFLFRDLGEMGNTSAQTAYGAFAIVPSGLDILIAGTACVDFSALNSKKEEQKDQGESMNTFNGLVRYVGRRRPTILVLENVRTAPWAKFAEAFRKVDYFSTVVKVDTKDYYIPQTRQRSYMVAFDAQGRGLSDVNKENILGHAARLVTQFKRPASSPAGMFCLGEEDARREQINRDLSTRLEASSSRAEIDWTRYQQRHKEYRLKERIGNDRPISRSEEGGVTCYAPEFYLHPWFDAQVERIWDTVDIKQLIAVSKSNFDISSKERWIDLSQGVDRGGENTDSIGVIGCLTPSGMPFASTQGVILSGLEALSLQGLPLDRMILTRESQRECQDLAGNAMTTTVVAATMLAALIAGTGLLAQGASQNAERPARPQTKFTLQLDQSENLSVTDFTDASSKQATFKFRQHPDVAVEVEIRLRGWKSARYCWCEKQSSLAPVPLECGLCGHTICSFCAGNPTHSYKPANRITSDPLEYVAFLKSALPMRVSLTGLRGSDYQAFQDQLQQSDWSEYLGAIDLALNGGNTTQLRFKEIKRSHIWTIIYEGPNGSMHLEVRKERFHWLYFARVPATKPAQCLLREILAKPIAKMIAEGDSLTEGTWQICSPISVDYRVRINGFGRPTKSFAAALNIRKNNLDKQTVYPNLMVDAKDNDMKPLEVDIRGEYTFLPDCGTALGSLYRKESEEGQQPVFLFFDPRKVGRIDHDSFVFSTEHDRIAGYEARSTIAELSNIWRPTHVRSHPQFVNAYSRYWRRVPSGKLRRMGKSELDPISLRSDSIIWVCDVNCRAAYVPLAGIRGPEKLIGMLGTGTSWTQMDHEKTNEILKSLVWAMQEFSTWQDFQEWRVLDCMTSNTSSSKKSETSCRTCEPPAPSIEWGRNEANQVAPFENPKQAARYERAVKSRPPPFIAFNRSEGQGQASLVVALNLQSLAHQARAKLTSSSTANVKLTWRLVPNYQDFGRQSFGLLKILQNTEEPKAGNPPNFKCDLRKDQLRSLGWMQSREEEGTRPFVRQVVEEACFPLLSWRAEVKAELSETIRGGVLADEVGFGKTAIVLGLVDCGFDETSRVKRPEAPQPEDSGLVSVKGTFILVPDNVFEQWASEIRKFLHDTYKVLEIRKVTAFAKIEVREMEDADIILVSWNVIHSPSYYQTLQRFTVAPNVPKACGRIFDSWFNGTVRSTRELVKILATKGTEGFLTNLAARRKSLATSDKIDFYAPSFRLRGAKFAAAQRLKGNIDDDIFGNVEEQDPEIVEELDADETSASRKKRKLTSTSTNDDVVDDEDILMSSPSSVLSDAMDLDPPDDFYLESEGEEQSQKTDNKTTDLSEGPVDNSESDSEFAESIVVTDSDSYSEPESNSKKRKRNTGKTHAEPKAPVEKSPAQCEAEDRKTFGIPKPSPSTAPMDWRSMKNLPLHAYRFERFVIDEYTYIGEDRRLPLVTMNARTKWILSGTPATDEFSDVKSIAQFLGLDLGEDDDGDAPTKNSRLKIIRRNMTALEKFMMYKPRRSNAWHEERHQLSSSFVNHFMRQNKVEKDGISVVQHYVVIEPSEMERELYQMLHAHLLARRGRPLKIRAPKEQDTMVIDKVTRLNKFMEKTRVPEESLLKCSATPSLDKHVGVAESNKVAEVVRVVSSTPEEEYVLLFVQFEDLMHVVAHAFETAGITWGMATSKNAHILRKYGEPDPTKARRKSTARSTNDDEEGYEGESEGEPHAVKGKGRSRRAASTQQKKPAKDDSIPKVLILHLGSAMAAGLNLQMINHVIFLSPLLAPTQHEYKSGMTQAIGRCRRYGQQRVVHIYHMLARYSADVNVFQDRQEGVVVLRGGEGWFVSRATGEGVQEDDELCAGPELRWESATG